MGQYDGSSSSGCWGDCGLPSWLRVRCRVTSRKQQHVDDLLYHGLPLSICRLVCNVKLHTQLPLLHDFRHTPTNKRSDTSHLLNYFIPRSDIRPSFCCALPSPLAAKPRFNNIYSFIFFRCHHVNTTDLKNSSSFFLFRCFLFFRFFTTSSARYAHSHTLLFGCVFILLLLGRCTFSASFSAFHFSRLFLVSLVGKIFFNLQSFQPSRIEQKF